MENYERIWNREFKSKSRFNSKLRLGKYMMQGEDFECVLKTLNMHVEEYLTVMETSRLECFFCKGDIEGNDDAACRFDITNNTESGGVQARFSRNFYSHFECLEKKLHPYFRGYLLVMYSDL